MFDCGDHYIYGWYGNGSYINNQYQGTPALLRSANWSYTHYVQPASPHSWESPFDWTPVDVVNLC